MITNISNSYIIDIKTTQTDLCNINSDVYINWNIFDKIYCIHYLPYSIRKKNITAELKRIGILNCQQFEWYYTVPNKYYDMLFYSNCNIDQMNVNSNNLNYTINSYNLLKLAYDQKFNRILIIEDDVAFLRNTRILKKYIDNFPLNYDVVNMETFICNTKIQLNKINSWYSSHNDIVYDTGFISLSRKAIEYIISQDNKKLMAFDGYTRKTNVISPLTYAISNENLAIQRDYAEKQDQFIALSKYGNTNILKYNV